MRVSSIRWGIVWIGIGILFLAINFEVLDSLVFPALFSLWPVLLIAIGVELIFRKTKLYFLALLSPLMIAAAFIFAASYGSGYSWSFNEFWKDWSWGYEGRKDFSYEIPFDAAIDTVHILMNLGESDFEVRPSNNKMFSLKTSYQKRSPQISYRTEGIDAYIEYKNREKGKSSIFKIKNLDLHSDIKIAGNVVLYAAIKVKTQRPDFDFSDFKLKGLNLSLRSDEVTITLGNRLDRVEIELLGRSDRLTLLLPSKFGVELRGDNITLDDLSGIENPELFSGGVRSGDFESNEKRIAVLLNGDIELVEVRHIN